MCFSKPIRITPLLATPVLAVLAVMIYWLRRMRRRQMAAISVRRLSSTISTPTAIMR
jgi:hypothetical protein